MSEAALALNPPKLLDRVRHAIRVREGKGGKDRHTMLPGSLKVALERHLTRVKSLHEQDLRAGYGRVWMPHALERKFPQASADRNCLGTRTWRRR